MLLFVQAVNKLAEIMNRKEFRQGRGGKDKAVGADLKRKEKDLRRAQQELTMVRHSFREDFCWWSSSYTLLCLLFYMMFVIWT